ncbi:MAG: flagellar biosynthesis protein FlhF [Desulfobulbus oligotrophicus]|jgi:flagellar biosynthesis protein FlhF|nr:flagellar biosynthesis protein FlhF [Desulfobulbus oligotrophicus]
MQVKVFEAPDMATGLKMVKEALGPDALILSTRTIRNGILGKPIMEITAAVDADWRQPEVRQPHLSPLRPPVRKKRIPPQADISYDELWARREPAPQPSSTPPVAEPPPVSREIQDELTELRSLVSGLSQRISRLDTPVAATVTPSPVQACQPTVTPAAVDPVTEFLTGYGINQETARVVARFTRDTLEQAGAPGSDSPQAVLKTAITRLFSTEQILQRPRTGQYRLSLIGPTGVGKTTTLAKIAAHYLSRFNGRIGLITIDTYRIAAVEQLKVYGEIMRLPLEVVINPGELEQALQKFSEMDLILIDTAGRNPRNNIDIQELASFFKPQLNIEHHLLLSAATREREVEETIRRFSVLPISNFIFTKIDECEQLGVLLNIHYKNDTPISFLTNGQRVPEDLLMPSPADIADLIINDHGNLHHG